MGPFKVIYLYIYVYIHWAQSIYYLGTWTLRETRSLVASLRRLEGLPLRYGAATGAGRFRWQLCNHIRRIWVPLRDHLRVMIRGLT